MFFKLLTTDVGLRAQITASCSSRATGRACFPRWTITARGSTRRRTPRAKSNKAPIGDWVLESGKVLREGATLTPRSRDHEITTAELSLNRFGGNSTPVGSIPGRASALSVSEAVEAAQAEAEGRRGRRGRASGSRRPAFSMRGYLHAWRRKKKRAKRSTPYSARATRPPVPFCSPDSLFRE